MSRKPARTGRPLPICSVSPAASITTVAGSETALGAATCPMPVSSISSVFSTPPSLRVASRPVMERTSRPSRPPMRIPEDRARPGRASRRDRAFPRVPGAAPAQGPPPFPPAVDLERHRPDPTTGTPETAAEIAAVIHGAIVATTGCFGRPKPPGVRARDGRHDSLSSCVLAQAVVDSQHARYRRPGSIPPEVRVCGQGAGRSEAALRAPLAGRR